MQSIQSQGTVESLQLTRDALRREVTVLQREYSLYMSMLQQNPDRKHEEKPELKEDPMKCKFLNKSGDELQLLREEHDRLSSEITFLQRELTMLEEENSDLFDAIEIITREKAQTENKLNKTREALELSKNSIDFFMAERDGFIKEKETKGKMIRTFEALFSRMRLYFLS